MSTVTTPVEHIHVIEVRIVIPGLHDPRTRLKVFAGGQDSADVIEFNPPPKIVQPEQTKVDSKTLVSLYEELLSVRDQERKVSAKTIRDNHSVLKKFEQWASDTGAGCGAVGSALLEVPGILRDFAGYLRNQPKGNSSSMATKALGVITKLTNACERAGIVRRRSDRVAKSVVNLMRPRTEQQRRVKAVPVTVEELKAMLAVVNECRWPRIGNLSPSVFWEVAFLSHYLYGFRSQDWFACRGSEKKGLLWSGVLTQTECPVIEGLHNSAGWAWYLVHKTCKKDEAAERPADVLVPLSSRVRELIERFRGIDSERVFPTQNNSRSYSEEFTRILTRAGLSDEARTRAGKPIIRLSLGQRNVASFRKGCAAWWSERVGRPAASYLLHHAVHEEGVSKTTSDNYLQDETILRKIVANIEEFKV